MELCGNAAVGKVELQLWKPTDLKLFHPVDPDWSGHTV